MPPPQQHLCNRLAHPAECGLFHFCRAMLCISAAIAGMRCLSVRPSVTFVSYAKTNKDIFEIFSPSGSHTILVFCTCGSNNWETVEDRWVHAARGLASTELSFNSCNVLRDCHRGVPRANRK